MIIYTDKDLVDVLPLRTKEIIDCGIDDKTITQIFCYGKVHSFMNVVDVNTYSKFRNSNVQNLTEEQADTLMAELKEKEAIEKEEARKQTVEYKMDMILEHLNQLNQNMSLVNKFIMRTLEEK